MNKAEITAALTACYEKHWLVKNGEAVVLPKRCPGRCACWEDVQEIRTPENDAMNRIAYPFIGKNYQGELALVGINMNLEKPSELLRTRYTGPEGQQRIIEDTAKGFRTNKNSKDPLGGSILLFHRAAVYANILLGMAKREDCVEPAGSPRIGKDYEALAAVFDRVVYLDAIKCSPPGKNSKPAEDMYEYCMVGIFHDELAILRPQKILIMGLNAFKTLVTNLGVFEKFSGNIRRFEASFPWGKTELWGIVHPAAPGGNHKTLYAELFDKMKGKSLL
jgi:hypothetical protein